MSIVTFIDSDRGVKCPLWKLSDSLSLLTQSLKLLASLNEVPVSFSDGDAAVRIWAERMAIIAWETWYLSYLYQTLPGVLYRSG